MKRGLFAVMRTLATQVNGVVAKQNQEYWKKYHDSDLHNEVPALRRHSIQGEARRTIQV